MILNLISTLIFLIGFYSLVLNRKNFLLILVSIELILLGANLNFLLASILFDDYKGIVFCVLILTLAASETAVGLTIIIIFFHHHKNLNLNKIFSLNG